LYAIFSENKRGTGFTFSFVVSFSQSLDTEAGLGHTFLKKIKVLTLNRVDGLFVWYGHCHKLPILPETVWKTAYVAYTALSINSPSTSFFVRFFSRFAPYPIHFPVGSQSNRPDTQGEPTSML